MKNLTNKHILSTYILAILICLAVGFGLCWKYFVRPLRVENDGVKVELQQINSTLDELKK